MRAPRRHWLRSVAVVSLVATAVVTVQALDARDPTDDFTITSWGLDDGLPSLRVWSIAEDSTGYLWLGTDDGLVRFDGVRFRRWVPISGSPIQKGAVVKVICGGDGSIWIGQGPAGEGVSRLIDGHVENFGRAGLSDSTITLLLEDRNHTIWAGNEDGLFELRDKHWNRLDAAAGVPRAAVSGGFEDSRGDLWIGTNKGILFRQHGTAHFALVDSRAQSVQGFAEDSTGEVLVTDPQQGFRSLRSVTAQSPGLTASGSQVLRDSRGDLWVATIDRGLWRVRRDGRPSVFLPVPAATRWPNDLIRALHQDRDGNIWVAADSGLDRFTPRKATALTDLGRSRILASTPDGSTWVGTAGGVVRLQGGSSIVYKADRGLTETDVTALTTDQNGMLWVATPHGISRLVDDRFVPVVVPHEPRLSNIRAIGVRSDGSLLIYDNDEGLFDWREGGMASIVPLEGIQGRRLRCLYVDREDRAWMSFTGGNVLMVTPDHRAELHRLPDEHTLINTIYEGPDGRLWLGGTQGLSQFTNARFITVPQSKLPGYAVFSIIADSQRNLWMGGALGIVRMSEEQFDAAVGRSDYQPQYELYDTSDGLAGMPVWFGAPGAVQNGGKLSFVTTGGVTQLDPAARDTRGVVPHVQLDSVAANGQLVSLAGVVKLPSDVRNMLFEYGVPSLTSSMKVTFRHRLGGVDADWVDTGPRRDVSYANLAPGTYSFDVIAISSDHGWSQSAASWQFSIEPMFYQTAWFDAVVVLSIGVMAWLLWRLRVRQLRRQFSLVLAERARMSREIHDTLLQGMVGVALQFDMLSHVAGVVSPLARHLVQLREEVEGYIRKTREAIFDLRVPRSEGDIADLLREAGARITEGTDIHFNVTVSGTARPRGGGVDRQLIHVAKEAITNAVRHANARRIQVKLDYRSDAIALRVSDDGKGFDLDHATSQPDIHFGLQTMRERTQQIGGRVRIVSSAGMGTDIEVLVPLIADL